MPERDRWMEALGRLPALDIDPARAARVRQQAIAALARRRETAVGPRAWWAALGRAWRSVGEPALAGAVAVVYLAWAVQATLAILAAP